MSRYKNSFLHTKTVWQSLIILIIIASPIFLDRSIYAPLVGMIGTFILISSLKNIKVSFIKIVLPLLFVFLIGIFGFGEHEFRHIMRDIAFSIFPVALIFIGYWLGGSKRAWPYVFKVFTVCAFILTLNHLLKFFSNPDLLSADVFTIRSEAGGIGSVAVLVLVLGLVYRKFDCVSLFPKFLPSFICISLLLMSFVLSFSRTAFLLMVIFILALLGLLNRLKIQSIFVAILIALAGYIFVITTPEGEAGTYRSKIVRSLNEIKLTDYSNQQDINENWRGFESKRAMESFSAGTIFSQFLGQGFGALVDLGFYMELAGESLRFIPVLHNGYIYILLKTGLVGLACYMIFYINIIKYAVSSGRSENLEQVFFSRLLLGCVAGLILSMLVVGGMAESSDAGLLVLLGYSMQRIELLKVMRYADSVRKNGVVI